MGKSICVVNNPTPVVKETQSQQNPVQKSTYPLLQIDNSKLFNNFLKCYSKTIRQHSINNSKFVQPNKKLLAVPPLNDERKTLRSNIGLFRRLRSQQSEIKECNKTS
ncbi:unnamed protein product [Didymodactylos carnosus]|uniref:Uncharacterized protein n=1 Tax=Didymodactylos carnosus TaxID=1234261 RepID=A0A814CIG9_9BILA|nr:unnamed protein product [Didymodactylos carnosus]CAF3717097.1 unnamed protein product [Didymodactylos carnosus]